MQSAEILTLLQHNFWATARILAQCESLTAEEFTRPVQPDPGWRDLRTILVHALDAEFGWRCILQALPGDELLQPEDFADAAALQARWAQERDAWLAYAAGLDETQLSQGYGTEPHSGLKVWQTILHVLLHSQQHRSEAAAILTGLDRSPGDLDLDVFLKENPELA